MTRGCAQCRRVPVGDAGPDGHVDLSGKVPTGLAPHDPPTVHLIGVGDHPAKPASELARGDRVVWNYGSASYVEAVEPKGRVQVVVRFTDEGPLGRTFHRDRLVAVR